MSEEKFWHGYRTNGAVYYYKKERELVNGYGRYPEVPHHNNGYGQYPEVPHHNNGYDQYPEIPQHYNGFTRCQKERVYPAQHMNGTANPTFGTPSTDRGTRRMNGRAAQMETEAMMELRRKKNREAAAKCRRKKEDRITSLQDLILAARARKEGLLARIADLEKENNQLLCGVVDPDLYQNADNYPMNGYGVEPVAQGLQFANSQAKERIEKAMLPMQATLYHIDNGDNYSMNGYAVEPRAQGLQFASSQAKHCTIKETTEKEILPIQTTLNHSYNGLVMPEYYPMNGYGVETGAQDLQFASSQTKESIKKAMQPIQTTLNHSNNGLVMPYPINGYGGETEAQDLQFASSQAKERIEKAMQPIQTALNYSNNGLVMPYDYAMNGHGGEPGAQDLQFASSHAKESTKCALLPIENAFKGLAVL